jgi:hypothetical protein
MTRRRRGSDLQAVERSITRDGVMTESLYWWFVERHLVRSVMQHIVEDDPVGVARSRPSQARRTPQCFAMPLTPSTPTNKR